MVSYASMGGSINRIAAAEAVASARTSRVLREGAQDQEIANLQLKAFDKKYANLMRSAAGWQSCAQSAASAVQSCVSAGQQIDSASQRMQQEPQVAENFDAVRNANPEDRAQALEQLRETPLGNGTVGDRYSNEQLNEMLDTDRAGDAIARDMYENPPEQRKTVGQAIRDAVQELGPKSTNEMLGEEAEAAEKRAGRHDELADHADALSQKVVADADDHAKAMYGLRREFKEEQRRTG